MEQFALERARNEASIEGQDSAREKTRAACIEFAQAFETGAAGLDKKIEQKPFYTKMSSRIW